MQLRLSGPCRLFPYYPVTAVWTADFCFHFVVTRSACAPYRRCGATGTIVLSHCFNASMVNGSRCLFVLVLEASMVQGMLAHCVWPEALQWTCLWIGSFCLVLWRTAALPSTSCRELLDGVRLLADGTPHFTHGRRPRHRKLAAPRTECHRTRDGGSSLFNAPAPPGKLLCKSPSCYFPACHTYRKIKVLA